MFCIRVLVIGLGVGLGLGHCQSDYTINAKNMVLKIPNVHVIEINFSCTFSSALPATGDSRKHNEAESNGCTSTVGKQVASVTVASHQ